jgi:hypothetical protein
MSSSFLCNLSVGGLSIWGGGVKGSFMWASPSYRMFETFLYFNAFFNIYYILLIKFRNLIIFFNSYIIIYQLYYI